MGMKIIMISGAGLATLALLAVAAMGEPAEAQAADSTALLEARVLELEARLTAGDHDAVLVVLTPDQAEALIAEAERAEAAAIDAARIRIDQHPQIVNLQKQIAKYEGWLETEDVGAKRVKLTEKLAEKQNNLQSARAEWFGKDPAVAALRERLRQLREGLARSDSPTLSLEALSGLGALSPAASPDAARQADRLPPLNAKVLAYAESQVGQKDGNGECWTLADHALDAAGADHPAVYVFGDLLGEDDTPLPGDIMQFEGVRFEWKEGRRWFSYSMGHHTAVVRDVNTRRPYRLEILHQNAGKLGRIVHAADLNLRQQVAGTIYIYRPRP